MSCRDDSSHPSSPSSSLEDLGSPLRSLTSTQEPPASPQEPQSFDEPTASQEPPARHPRLCHSDIGAFVGAEDISDSDKYRLVEEHFVPEPAYKFPRASNGRSFQHRWLLSYHWLRYSELKEGGYCLPCALFYKPTVNFRSDPGVLVTKPLTNFQKALEILKKHSEKQFHRSAVSQMEEFLKVMRNEQPSIRRQLSEATAKRIATNHQKLRSIVETIVLCGRQNIPLRGHRDSIMDIERTPNAQHGNFWALLQFRIAAGDVVLRDHVAHSSKNVTYTSSRIQNQILDILGSSIVRVIVQRVRDATFYTVIADEVTDCSNKEQLSLVLRYVSQEDNLIREDFIGFIECDCGITGRALAEKILSFLSTLGLDPTNLRGQAYDGAGNMSGRVNGTAAVQYPLALYLHRTSHSLNLAVVKSLDETSVRNMIGIVNRVSIFFSAHPKRQRKLEEAIDRTQSESAVKKLKDLCRTRWVERIDALNRFKSLHSSIVSCFETISVEGSSSWTPDSLTDASTLLLAISTTDFSECTCNHQYQPELFASSHTQSPVRS